MATFPVLKVEIAFVSNPLDTAPTWVDVTAYVRHANGVDITRGRSDPWSHFMAGHLTLTFSNRDRRFDSLYSAGPYFGNLKPGKQIRVTCTWSAVTYDLFRGFVGVWPQEFSNAGKDATVTVECYDGLEWAAGNTLSSDPYADYLLAIATPKLWFRQADANHWDDAEDSYEPNLIGGNVNAVATLAPGLQSQAVQFTGTSYFQLNTSYARTSGAWAFGFWIKTTVMNGNIFRRYDNLIGEDQVVCNVAGGVFQFSGNNTPIGTPNTFTINSAQAINDGQVHFCTMSMDAAHTNYRMCIDGVDVTATATGSISGSGMYQLRLQRVGANGSTYFGSGSSTTTLTPTAFLGPETYLQDLFVIEAELTAAQSLALYQIGIGKVTEDSASRFGRYLDAAGWPSTWRDTTTSPRATVDTFAYNGQQLITSLQELENSEQGRIFVSKSGNFTLYARYYNNEVTRGSTSQATFTDDGTAFNYRDFGYTQDDTDVRNDVTVANTIGSSRSTDSTSITANRRRSETVNTILSTVEQRQAMAAGLVVQWKDATVRVKQFTAGVPTNWATFLGLEIGDKITVKQTPMGVGSQFSKDLIVDQISWHIDAAFWELRIAAAPSTPNGLNWFVLDSSALDGADILGY